jgi:hypothetical protein
MWSSRVFGLALMTYMHIDLFSPFFYTLTYRISKGRMTPMHIWSVEVGLMTIITMENKDYRLFAIPY